MGGGGGGGGRGNVFFSQMPLMYRSNLSEEWGAIYFHASFSCEGPGEYFFDKGGCKFFLWSGH